MAGGAGMRKSAKAVIVAVFITGGAVACSDDDNSKSETSAAAAVCDERNALRDSVDELKAVDVVEEGTESLRTAISEITKEVESLVRSGEQAIRPELDAVKASLSRLESALRDVPSNGLQPVTAAVDDTGEAAGDLVTKVEALPCE